MPIKSVYLIPHGTMILDPTKQDKAYQPEIEPLSKALQTITEQMTKDTPDIIILITPHGFSLSQSHGVYLNSKAFGRGDSEEPEKWDEFKVSANIDLELSKKLISFMNSKLPNRFDGITQFSEEFTAQLGWGELVPLCKYFNDTTQSKTKLIILSLSSARHDQVQELVQESHEIGKLLWEFSDKQDLQVSLVVSVDLAHTHKITKGPEMGKEPYGITEESIAFDDNCEEWARNPTNEYSLKLLLVENRKLAPMALSCGYLGVIMASGLLKRQQDSGRTIKTTFLCRGHPTYFGMMLSYYLLV